MKGWVRGQAASWFAVLACLVLLLTGRSAHAEVVRSGDWPDGESVTLSVEGAPRSEAIARLADEAGWNLVAQDLGQKPVFVKVEQQPAYRVLTLLLAGDDYSVERHGSLVAISPLDTTSPGVSDASGSATVSPGGLNSPRDTLTTARNSPGTSSAAASKKESETPPSDSRPQDRLATERNPIITEDAHIGRDEVVHDLIIWGGDVVVEGTVTGGIGVFGGSVTFLNGSSVAGDVGGVGSSIKIQNGAQIDGEVGVLAGSIHRGDEVDVRCTTCGDENPEKPVAAFLEDLAARTAGVSLLWVFGAILLAVALRRARIVQDEVLGHPVRSIGIGLIAVIAVLVAMGALVVTLIGIPLAILVGLVAGLLGYIGFCLVVLAGGSKVVRGRTDNPYLHLAAGCIVYFLVASIPVAGTIVSFLVALAGLGALVASRGAGLLSSHRRSNDLPPTDTTGTEKTAQ